MFFTVILIFVIIAIGVLMVVSKPVLWAMTRLRLIYPIGTIIVLLFIDAHEDWLISKILTTKPIPIIDWEICDMILLVVCMISALSLLQELIQMVVPTFSWKGVIAKFFNLFRKEKIEDNDTQGEV